MFESLRWNIGGLFSAQNVCDFIGMQFSIIDALGFNNKQRWGNHCLNGIGGDDLIQEKVNGLIVFGETTVGQSGGLLED